MQMYNRNTNEVPNLFKKDGLWSGRKGSNPLSLGFITLLHVYSIYITKGS